MRKYPVESGGLLLIAAATLQTTAIPTVIGYVFISILIILLSYTKLNKHRVLVADRTALIIVGVIVVGFLPGVIVNTTSAKIIRLAAFSLLTPAILFILSNSISINRSIETFSLWMAMVIAAYIPLAIQPSLSLGPLEITSWSRFHPFLPINTISGPFPNPNTLGYLAAFAGVGAFPAILGKNINRKKLTMFVINSIGVLLSASRGGLLLLCSGISAVVIARFSDRLTVGTTVALLAGPPIVPITVVLFPTMTDLINLSGRGVLWQASVTAIINNPMGYGPGVLGSVIEPYTGGTFDRILSPHNSYLKIGISSGIVGMICYICLISAGLIKTINKSKPLLFGLMSCVVITQVFNASSIFGLGPISVLTATIVGASVNPLPMTNADGSDSD